MFHLYLNTAQTLYYFLEMEKLLKEHMDYIFDSGDSSENAVVMLSKTDELLKKVQEFKDSFKDA